MVDMEKVKMLSSLLEDRSGLTVCDALVRFYDYLSNEEMQTYDHEVDYLVESLGVEVELPF